MSAPVRPLPGTQPGSWPAMRPGRFAQTIRTDSPQGCQIALLGLPDDTGVRLNLGRPGAAAGPAAFRNALAATGTTWDTARQIALAVRVFDAGDVLPATGDDEAALLATHARVAAIATQLHQLGLTVVGIGGGHDLSLPGISALSTHAGGPLGGVNLDAHLDVREKVGSGMPFRRLIEGGWLDPKRFVELGLGRFACDRGDVEWLRQQGARLVLAEDVARDGVRTAEVLSVALAGGTGFVSIDLDGLDAAFAPGVSAPNPFGLGVGDAVALAEAAGRDARVRHFDLMELCPPHDLGGRTARTAAYLFLSFVSGYQQRSP
jgi:formiminoglutamase